MSNTKIKPVLVRGGKVIDPITGINEHRDILIEDGKIAAVARPGEIAESKAKSVVDATGRLITPGLVDIHVHFREPGEEWKETIETGSRAAVAGGFTEVCCMPNTRPTNDSASVTEHINERAAVSNLCRVRPIGAITMGRKGESLAPMMELLTAGCVAFSDDGFPVANAQIMRRALEYSSMFDTVLAVHEEDLSLSNRFSMNESPLSIKLGLQGMPDAAENVMIARDIELTRLTGGHVHFCHVSTARGVTLIARAKEDGITVTAETAPHYLVATEKAVAQYDTNAKMSMPLRGEEDVAALRDAVRDGVIDCIASDHAPHESDSKLVEFDKASYGTLGLQTTLPLVLQCVREGAFSLERAIDALTGSARRCLKLSQYSLAVGQPADLVVIDLDRKEVATKEFFVSKSKNSMFLGWELQGFAERTFVGGREVFAASEYTPQVGS